MYALLKTNDKFIKNIFLDLTVNRDEALKLNIYIAEIFKYLLNKFTKMNVSISKMQALPKTKIDMDLGQNIP